MVEYCPFCETDTGEKFPCTECSFCTKFYHNGERIIKKRVNVNPLDIASRTSRELGVREHKYKEEIVNGSKRDSGVGDDSVPTSYYPLSEKEAEESLKYDYDFVDLMTTDEVRDRLDKVVSDLHLRGRKLF